MGMWLRQCRDVCVFKPPARLIQLLFHLVCVSATSTAAH